MNPEVLPSVLERSLTLDILRGRYAPGSRLPTIREMAEAQGVTPATIQRVVSRLETRGLVTARQGSGLRVNDPATCGDLSLVPLWLEASLDAPPRAVRILEDFLELRRVIAARLLVRHRAAILARATQLHAAAARMTEASTLGVDALRDADMAFARAVLAETGNHAAVALLNTLARVFESLPLVAEAMYADPSVNTDAMARVLGALLGGRDDAAAAIESALAAVDARTVARFDALIRRALDGRP